MPRAFPSPVVCPKLTCFRQSLLKSPDITDVPVSCGCFLDFTVTLSISLRWISYHAMSRSSMTTTLLEDVEILTKQMIVSVAAKNLFRSDLEVFTWNQECILHVLLLCIANSAVDMFNCLMFAWKIVLKQRCFLSSLSDRGGLHEHLLGCVLSMAVTGSAGTGVSSTCLDWKCSVNKHEAWDFHSIQSKWGGISKLKAEVLGRKKLRGKNCSVSFTVKKNSFSENFYSLPCTLSTEAESP